MTYRYVDPDRMRWAQIVLLCLAVIWGTDYLITPNWAIAPSLTVVESAFPIPVWGAVFLFGGVMGLVGELWLEIGRNHTPPRRPPPLLCRAENRWWVSFTAHAGLCSLYTSVGVGYALDLLQSWHVWGCRAPALMFAFAFGHWVFMSRRKDV
jgi:hypothetical protein